MKFYGYSLSSLRAITSIDILSASVVHAVPLRLILQKLDDPLQRIPTQALAVIRQRIKDDTFPHAVCETMMSDIHRLADKALTSIQISLDSLHDTSATSDPHTADGEKLTHASMITSSPPNTTSVRRGSSACGISSWNKVFADQSKCYPRTLVSHDSPPLRHE